MPITIGSNIASLNAQRRLESTTGELSKISTRLSSGARINTATDDAAGLSISATLNTNIRVGSQAIRNINDGISFLSVAEGTLDALSTIVTRQLELAEQAANGTYSYAQRRALDSEADALTNEYNRIVRSSKFNGIQVFDPNSGALNIQAGIGVENVLAMKLGERMSRFVNNGYFSSTSATTTISDWAGTSNSLIGALDANGDGRTDIITSNSVFNFLYVTLANSDGTFSAPQTLTNSFGSFERMYSVASGDVNRDGITDMVTIGDSGKYQVFIGQGNGTFQQGSTGTLASQYGVSLVDLDGDGILDVASTGSAFAYRRGNGDGTFGAIITTFTVPPQANYSVGDVDGDGDIDVIEGGEYAINFYQNNGSGGFTQKTLVSTTQHYYGNMQVGDINSDGKTDMYVATDNYSNLLTFLGNGDGTFSIGATISGYRTFVELNGDDIQDLGQYSSSSVGIAVNNGTGSFSTVLTSAISGFTNGSFIDINGDGVKDILSYETGSGAFRAKVIWGSAQYSVTQSSIDITSQSTARSALDSLRLQLDKINSERSAIGAFQSRFNAAVSVLSATRQNEQTALGRIADADMAEDMAHYVKTKIVQQAATSVLAQANIQPQVALILLNN